MKNQALDAMKQEVASELGVPLKITFTLVSINSL